MSARADACATRSPRTAGDIDRAIGALLRNRRKAAGFTIEDTAKAVGISYQQMQKYEAGQNRIAASRLVAIANYLGAAPADLLPSPAPEGRSA